MATYGGHKHPTDSDHCNPCFILDGNKIDPSYRCEECQHRLCDECFKNHRRNLTTRDHIVIALQHLATSQFQVSGRRANNEDQTGTKPKVKSTYAKSRNSSDKQSKHPTSEVSGRRAQHDTRFHGKTDDTKSLVSSSQHQSETPQYEVSGRRVTGSDSVDQDQTGISSMKNMRLDARTSSTQTTRQTGKPYTTATLKHSLNVKRENDKHDCYITGLVVLQDKLIVCDENNCNLKVYDSSYRFLYEYKCVDIPFDIAMLDVNTVVVSSIYDMRLLSVGNDSMNEIRKITTKEWCLGVCCFEGKIYMVVRNFKDSKLFSEVRIYTTDGRLFQKFAHLSDGKEECNNLRYITVNPQTGILYVTDWYEGVLALSTSGDAIAVMSPPQLKDPQGIAVDDRGHIYVCGYWSNNVIQMSLDGGHVIEILSGRDKCEWPVCVKNYGNKMYVSHEDPKCGDYKISVYQLS